MTRTLADMTPAERQVCVGRWAEVRRRLVIITEIDERHGDATVFRVETLDIEWYFLPDITPRLDLPRAWTPSGEPVDGVWAKGHVHIEEEGRSIECQTTGDLEIHYWGEPSRVPSGVWDTETARRFITDWEVAP